MVEAGQSSAQVRSLLHDLLTCTSSGCATRLRDVSARRCQTRASVHCDAQARESKKSSISRTLEPAVEQSSLELDPGHPMFRTSDRSIALPSLCVGCGRAAMASLLRYTVESVSGEARLHRSRAAPPALTRAQDPAFPASGLLSTSAEPVGWQTPRRVAAARRVQTRAHRAQGRRLPRGADAASGAPLARAPGAVPLARVQGAAPPRPRAPSRRGTRAHAQQIASRVELFAGLLPPGASDASLAVYCRLGHVSFDRRVRASFGPAPHAPSSAATRVTATRRAS